MTAAATLDVAKLYQQHGSLVLRRIRRFYRKERAHDVLHEVFAKVIEKGHTFRGESSPVSWLYGLTTRHCLAKLRDEKRRRELLDEIGDVPWSCPIQQSNTESRVFLQELWRTVEPELAQIGVYYYIDGMSQADIGELLGVSGRTISNRLEELARRARNAAGERP